MNVEDLAKRITATQKKTTKGEKVKADAIGFDAITDMIGKLNSVIQDLSGTYKVQEQPENLNTFMKEWAKGKQQIITGLEEMSS